MRRHTLTLVALASVPLLFSSAAGAQELRLFGGGHFQTAGPHVAEAFSARSGIATSYTPGNTGNGGMQRRIEGGEVIDVVILNSDEMAEEAELGNIMAGSYATFARDRMGLAVLEGAAVPDISTPEKLREVLLSARAIGMSEPDPMGHSGKNVVEILTNLGIWEQVQPKTVVYSRGLTEELADGTIDIGFWSYPELLRREGIEVVGAAPKELGGFTDQAVGIPATSTNVEGARVFIEYLTGPEAVAAYEPHGLDPPAE